MSKPTIFSFKVENKERLVFRVEERSSGDLTIIIKQSVFESNADGSTPSDAPLVVEERISVHCSPESIKTNVIKYTKTLTDGRQIIHRNYTESIKLHNQFSAIFIRRCGHLYHDRYVIPSTKGNILSHYPNSIMRIFSQSYSSLLGESSENSFCVIAIT
jgi:hypothetical protein